MKGIIINELNQDFDELTSTAIDDYTIRNLKDDQLVMHLFQHEGINMGYDDLKEENFEKGLDYYRKLNERVILRSSGGRSIVSDKGVLNLSLIFKSEASLYENYDFFRDFIVSALRPLTSDIEEGEIEGACCPGKTDLSINGKKFCGTAQRKVKEGVALVCYISVNGDQRRRNQLVKDFYDACQSNEISIDEEVMDCLSHLLDKEISVETVAKLFEKELSRHTELIMYQTDTTKKAGYKEALQYTLKRNEVLLDN